VGSFLKIDLKSYSCNFCIRKFVLSFSKRRASKSASTGAGMSEYVANPDLINSTFGSMYSWYWGGFVLKGVKMGDDVLQVPVHVEKSSGDFVRVHVRPFKSLNTR